MSDRLLSIARNTFVETIRQPIYGVLVSVTALLLILNIFLAGFTLQDDDKLLMDLGLSTILLSGLFLSAFSATGVLTREIENKTAMTILSKPVTRTVFILGKYLGLMAAQCAAFYVSFLIFILCMHHRVMQYATDPFDWPAILLGGGSGLLAIVLAALANYFYGKEFCSTAVALILPLLTLGTVATCFFDRDLERSLFLQQMFKGGQLFFAVILIMTAVLLITAIALAASTRLGQVMTLMTCAVAMMIGFLSDWFLGQHQGDSALAFILYRAIPNVNFFWVVDAVTAGNVVPVGYVIRAVVYAMLFVIAILLIGVALFQRREVG